MSALSPGFSSLHFKIEFSQSPSPGNVWNVVPYRALQPIASIGLLLWCISPSSLQDPWPSSQPCSFEPLLACCKPAVRGKAQLANDFEVKGKKAFFTSLFCLEVHHARASYSLSFRTFLDLKDPPPSSSSPSCYTPVSGLSSLGEVDWLLVTAPPSPWKFPLLVLLRAGNVLQISLFIVFQDTSVILTSFDYCISILCYSENFMTQLLNDLDM